MKHPIILLLVSGFLVSSCTTNYLVDPVPTPVFTHEWQAEVEASKTTDRKLDFEAACSLPSNVAIVATHESWSSSLLSDVEMSSLAGGKYWSHDEASYLALIGVATGSTRTGPGEAIFIPFITGDIGTLEGTSDFRECFLQIQTAMTLPMHPFMSTEDIGSSSFGGAARVEYLDRYQFNQTTIQGDTTIDNASKHSLNLDLVGFVSVGISFVNIYGQILMRLPLAGYQSYMDPVVATAGVKLTF